MSSLATPLSHVRVLACRALTRSYHQKHRTAMRAAPTHVHYPLHHGKKPSCQKVFVASPRLSSPAQRAAALRAASAADDAAAGGGETKKQAQQPYDAAALLNKSGAWRVRQTTTRICQNKYIHS